MSLGIHNLKPNSGARKKVRRVGRGNASGRGTYSGRGAKGQKARSGGRNKLKQKGWRNILLSTPKLRGFKSFKLKPIAISLEKIQSKFSDNEKVNPQTLLEKKIITRLAPVKLIGGKNFSKKIEVSDCQITSSAKELIIKAGGKIL